MKQFIAALRKSVYSPDFYKELLLKPFSSSMKYFFMLALAVSFIYAAILGARAAPSLNDVARNIGPTIVKYWPEELEIVIQNGRASTNAAEPYFIQLPDEFRKNVSAPSAQELDYIAVVDTQHPFDLEKFYSYKTAALLTKDSLVVLGRNGQVRIQSISRFPDATLNKKAVDAFVTRYIEPLAKFAAPIFIGGMFLFTFLVQILGLIYLLFLALLVWGVARIKKVRVGYGKAYQLAIHAATTGRLANLFLLGFLDARIPFLLAALTIVAAWFNLRQESVLITSGSTSPPAPTA